MNYKRKLKRIQKEIGYKKISAYISEDNGTLRINNHTFLLHDIANVYVDTVFHDSIDIPINEEENYDFLKGFVCSEIFDSPLGWLGGIETITTYEKVMIQRVELILQFNNGKCKRYITGIFDSFDDSLYECIEKTEKRCHIILDVLKSNNIEINQNIKTKKENHLFQFILKGLEWSIKIFLFLTFFPFAIIFYLIKDK